MNFIFKRNEFQKKVEERVLPSLDFFNSFNFAARLTINIPELVNDLVRYSICLIHKEIV